MVVGSCLVSSEYPSISEFSSLFCDLPVVSSLPVVGIILEIFARDFVLRDLPVVCSFLVFNFLPVICPFVT